MMTLLAKQLRHQANIYKLKNTYKKLRKYNNYCLFQLFNTKNRRFLEQ